jgi:enoyl-CoA hydratase
MLDFGCRNLVYSMEEIDARAAWDVGIVSKVVAAEQIGGSVAEFTALLTARSREALVAVKDYLRSAPMMEPRGAADYAGNLLCAVLSSAGR